MGQYSLRLRCVPLLLYRSSCVGIRGGGGCLCPALVKINTHLYSSHMHLFVPPFLWPSSCVLVGGRKSCIHRWVYSFYYSAAHSFGMQNVRVLMQQISVTRLGKTHCVSCMHIATPQRVCMYYVMVICSSLEDIHTCLANTFSPFPLG